jgi:hypothetical protein
MVFPAFLAVHLRLAPPALTSRGNADNIPSIPFTADYV